MGSPASTTEMVQIETVDLSTRGVQLPSDRVGMVVAQPHLPRSSLTAQEPYQYTDQARPTQLDMIARTLEISQAAPHRVAKTHFTVFPEYSIPGTEGIALVDATLSEENWPRGTIVIGGTDGLTKDAYEGLLQAPATHVDVNHNAAALVPAGQWVNCLITWVKTADGQVERWIQPKLRPAWEQADVCHQHMFHGGSVYLFKGVLDNNQPYRFGTLVCFDWIVSIGIKTPCQWLLEALQRQAGEGQLPLSWLFVIQHNKKPSHKEFLKRASDLFDQTQFPNALRERTCLIFANTAGAPRPGRVAEFGASSLVLSPQSLFVSPACAPTFANGGKRFRDGSDLLPPCKDVFFRERGACIHSFAQINPGSVVAGAAGRTVAVDEAYVWPTMGVPEPRAPGAPVPAPVKWLNDELDAISSLSASYSTAPLAAQIDVAHSRNVSALRQISSQATTDAIKLSAQESAVQHADDWDKIEAEGLTHLVHTLDIVTVNAPPTLVGGDYAHAVVEIGSTPIDLVAIRGTSHESCIEHSMAYRSGSTRQSLLVSRDPDNTLWCRRFGNFLDVEEAKLGDEKRITDPSSGSVHLGYQNLLDIFRNSATVVEIERGISAQLAA